MAEVQQEPTLELVESFADLGLTIGCHLTIETIASARKYQVSLIGFWDKRSILVSPPLRDGREVLLDKDTVIAIRLLEGKKVCAFETKIIYRSSHPYTYYHLQFPESVNTRQVRNSERVETQIQVEVDSDFDIVGDWPKPATITNLSKTGARMLSPHSLGEKGHELVLMFELRVSDMNKLLRIPCLIRNIQLDPNSQQNDQVQYIIGAEFLDMNDEHRLSLSSYIYENEHK
ncbi:MAG: flagellar brake protein [Oleiphilus sp.]